jgi:hypothetical protein
MTVDDPNHPTEATITWTDPHCDVDVTLTPYAARITSSTKPQDVHSWSGSMVAVVRNTYTYLDVLWHEPPTTGRWQPLTRPGQHTHPDDRSSVLGWAANPRW